MKIAVDYLTFHESAPYLDFEKYLLPEIDKRELNCFSMNTLGQL